MNDLEGLICIHILMKMMKQKAASFESLNMTLLAICNRFWVILVYL